MLDTHTYGSSVFKPNPMWAHTVHTLWTTAQLLHLLPVSLPSQGQNNPAKLTYCRLPVFSNQSPTEQTASLFLVLTVSRHYTEYFQRYHQRCRNIPIVSQALANISIMSLCLESFEAVVQLWLIKSMGDPGCLWQEWRQQGNLTPVQLIAWFPLQRFTYCLGDLLCTQKTMFFNNCMLMGVYISNLSTCC